MSKEDPDPPRDPHPKEDDGTQPLFPEKKTPGETSPLTSEEEARVLHLHERGIGTRRIARRLGRGRHKIRRALQRAGRLAPAKPKARQSANGSNSEASTTTEGSKLDPYREAIKEKVEQGLTVSRILRELREDDYTGGRSILADYVRKLQKPLAPKASQKVTRRFETEPGRETQVDWSVYRVELGGRTRTVHALAMILGHSRYAFLRFFENERQARLLEGLETGFHSFHGVTRDTVFDNMATVVLGRVGRDRQPIWNRELLELTQHYGTQPKLCQVAHPDRKGEVEAFLGYAERDFLRGRKAESLQDLNRQVERWLREIANRRRHGTTGEIPEEAWASEKPFLIALPETTFPGACEVEWRRVAEDCTVSIQGTRYSVPSRLAHQQVRVRLYAERFEVLDRDGSVALGRTYAVGDEAGRLQLEPAHYEGLASSRSNRGGKSQRLKDQVLERWPSLEDFVAGLEGRLNKAAHFHLRMLLRLATSYGERPVEAAALRAHEHRLHNVNSVRRILEQDQPLPDETPLPLDNASTTAARALLEDAEDEATLEDFAHLDEADQRGEDADDDGE